MKSYFKALFYELLAEDMTAGAGGVFGDADSLGHGGAIDKSDFYATGDTRIPQGPGVGSRSTWKDSGEQGPSPKKKRKKGTDKGNSIKTLIPVQRRPLTKDM